MYPIFVLWVALVIYSAKLLLVNERGNIHIHIHIHNIDMQFCCLEMSVNINIASWSYFNTWEGVSLVRTTGSQVGKGCRGTVEKS